MIDSDPEPCEVSGQNHDSDVYAVIIAIVVVFFSLFDAVVALRLLLVLIVTCTSFHLFIFE